MKLHHLPFSSSFLYLFVPQLPWNIILEKPNTHNFKKTMQSASVQGAGESVGNQESSFVKLDMRDSTQFLNSGRTGEKDLICSEMSF